MNNFSLQPYDILRTEKVQWIFKLNGEVLNSIQSASLRKFLKTTQEVLDANNITLTQGSIEEEQYAKWYEFYLLNMEERGYDVFAPKNLIEKVKNEEKEVEGIFLYKDSQIVGGGIVVKKGTQRASLAYKASLRLSLGNKKNSSLGAIIDYLFLEKMKKDGISTITGGRSRNAFGVVNSFGHLEYKLRFGYTPVLDTESELISSISLEEKNAVAFIGTQLGKNSLFLLKKPGTEIGFDLSKFSTPELPYKELELK